MEAAERGTRAFLETSADGLGGDHGPLRIRADAGYFFYALLLGPVALGATLARRDLLDKRRFRSGGTAWQEADSAKPDLERAKLTT
jgi:hypothetical protein